MVTDAQRRELYTALRNHLGSTPAEEPPGNNLRDAAASIGGQDRSWRAGRFPAALEVMMDLLPSVGWGDVARRADISQLDGRIDRIDGRIDQLDGRIAAQLPRLIAANLAGGFATAGLVLAAARLA